MRKKSPVLALSAILASLLLIAARHPADAACASGSSPDCDVTGQSIGPLAEMGMRPGPEDSRPKEPDLPMELWDRVRRLPLPGPEFENLNARIADITHKIMDARAMRTTPRRKLTTPPPR